MLQAEHWKPRLDISPGDYEVIPSKVDPRKARVVHVLCREEPTEQNPLGEPCVYEAVDILPDPLPLREAWLWYMSLKIFAATGKVTGNHTRNYLDTLKEV